MSKPDAKRRYRLRRQRREIDKLLDRVEELLGGPETIQRDLSLTAMLGLRLRSDYRNWVPFAGEPVRLDKPLMGVPPKPLTLAESMALLDGMRCAYCGKPGGLLCAEHNPWKPTPI